MKSIIGIAILSIAATAAAAPKSINYYMDHVSAKLPSTSIGYVFNLAKFNDATVSDTGSLVTTTTTNAGDSVSISLYLSNQSGVKQAVYVQSSNTLTSSAKAVCVLPATPSSQAYSSCVANVQPITGSQYNIFVVPDSTSAAVTSDLTSNGAYTPVSTCLNSTPTGGGTSLSGGIITAPAPSTLTLQIGKQNCTIT